MNPQSAAAALKRRLLSLSSPLTTELMGNAGCDWALIDLEHGAGSESEALHQPHPLSGTQRTVQAAHAHGKALGFRFIASGSDAVLLNNVARNLVQSLREKLA